MSSEARREREARVFAELALTTLAPLDDDLLASLAPAVTRAAAELAPLWIPAGLLVDLCALLLAPTPRLDLAAARARGGLPTHHVALRHAAASTFDALLAPIAVSPLLTEVRERLARHPRAIALDAGGVLASELAARVGAEAARPESGGLATLRRALSHPAAEIVATGTLALLGADVAGELALRHGALASKARSSGALLTRADVVIAEAAPELRQRAARLALRQLGAAEEQLLRLAPRTIRRKKSRRSDETAREHDDGTYPMGGFSSMTNVGTLENVVSSELALASDGDLAEDLFTIRWATGELLYYTRDESLAHRRRVSLWLALSPELARSGRVREAGAPFQRGVLALAACCALATRASELLRHEALEVHVWCPSAELAEERALLSLQLAALVARGVVQLHEGDADALRAQLEAASERCDLLLVEVGGSNGVEGALRLGEAQGGVERWAEELSGLLAALP